MLLTVRPRLLKKQSHDERKKYTYVINKAVVISFVQTAKLKARLVPEIITTADRMTVINRDGIAIIR